MDARARIRPAELPRIARMRLMTEAGARRVITNADRPEAIAWYERHFGCRKVGSVRKVHEFGLPEADSWTTLEAPLALPEETTPPG